MRNEFIQVTQLFILMLSSLLLRQASASHTAFNSNSNEDSSKEKVSIHNNNDKLIMNPSNHKNGFKVPPNYDYSKSTTENYMYKGPGEPPFVGKYANLRIPMDYSYHKHYTVDRQLLHDRLIDKATYNIVAKEGTILYYILYAIYYTPFYILLTVYYILNVIQVIWYVSS